MSAEGRMAGRRVLINVGMGGSAWLSGTSAESWGRTFALNARAHFLGCKLALRHLDDDGAVVLVSPTGASQCDRAWAHRHADGTHCYPRPTKSDGWSTAAGQARLNGQQLVIDGGLTTIH